MIGTPDGLWYQLRNAPWPPLGAVPWSDEHVYLADHLIKAHCLSSLDTPDVAKLPTLEELRQLHSRSAQVNCGWSRHPSEPNLPLFDGRSREMRRAGGR